jgi:hypothetical protein
MYYFLLAVLLAGVCVVLFRKPHKKRETAVAKVESVRPEPVSHREPDAEPVIRSYVPGPKLTKNDDAFYVVVQAAVAQALAAEGINPEGGFAIRQIKPVRGADAAPLSLKENEALYAVITAAVGQALSAEGINPEGGFAIRSIMPVSI